jgi:hypothetical protein
MHDAMHDAMHRYGCRNSYGCTRIQQLALCEARGHHAWYFVSLTTVHDSPNPNAGGKMLRPILALGLGSLLGHVRADDSISCSSHADCSTQTGFYCEGEPPAGTCASCSFLADQDCDAVDNDCCSATFKQACPSVDMGCVAKIPCTTSAEYTAAMSSLTSSCCPTPSACATGTPTSCPKPCADATAAVVESCGTMITAQPQNIQDQIAGFHQLCEDQREQSNEANGGVVIDNGGDTDGGDGDGGDGYGGDGDGGDPTPDTCGSVSDCKPGNYCDTSFTCYDCGFIGPAACDTIDNNCCSPEFLKNCPGNPFQCPTQTIQCATASDYSHAMANLRSTCCVTPGACATGVPTTCSTQCGIVLDEIAENCEAQIKLQPASIQTQIASFHEVCVQSAKATKACNTNADCVGVGLYCEGPDAPGTCASCSFLKGMECDAVGNDCCSAAFLKQCPSNPLAAQCAGAGR